VIDRSELELVWADLFAEQATALLGAAHPGGRALGLS